MAPICSPVRSTTPKRVRKRLRSKTTSARPLWPTINLGADFYQVLHSVSKQDCSAPFALTTSSPSDRIDFDFFGTLRRASGLSLDSDGKDQKKGGKERSAAMFASEGG